MRPSILTAILLLGGCATVYDLDNRMPDGRYVSAKAPATLAQCISGQVSRLGTYDIDAEGETRWITLRTQSGHPAARITIRRSSTGSVVLVHQTISYNLEPLVARCL